MTTQSFIGKDGFTWWVGQVEKNDGDPAGLGRVKVRIAGWYTGENYKENIPTDMLPWAHVMQPTTEVGIKNIGKSNNRLGVGAVVMGFFLDGEEAQQPCIMGILRSFLNTGTDDKEKLKAGEWIADIKGNGGGFTNVATADINHNRALGHELTRQSSNKKGSRENSNDAASNASLNTNPGRSDDGTGPQNTGPAGAGSTKAPASAANPSGVPSACPRPVSNGKKGDFQEYVDTLRYMLCDLGVTIGSVGKGYNGEFFSAFTGSLINIDTIIAKIKRFISYAFNGLFAELKAGIANLIGDAVTTLMSEFAALPFVYQLLIDTAIRIVNRFMCDFELGNNFAEAISNAANFVQGFADSILDSVASAITDSISGALLTVENITNNIQNSLGQAIQIAGSIASALQTAKDTSEAAKAVSETAEFWSTQAGKDLITNIVNFVVNILLDLLFPDPCRRDQSDDRVKNWMPLYGTSECDAEVLRGYEREDNNPYKRSNSPWNENLLNAATTFVENFADGSYEQSSAEPGKRFKRKVDHAGNSHVTDEKGNTHEHKASTETKIIEGDKCEHVKGNYVIEVDGDLILKIHGDQKISTDGATNQFTSAGPEVDKEGNVKGNGRARESTHTDGSDFSREYKGSWHIGANKASIHAAEGIDLKAQKGRINLQGASIAGSAPAIGWSSTITTNFSSKAEYNIVGASISGLASSALGGGVLDPSVGQFNFLLGKRITTFLSPTLSTDTTIHLAPASVVTHKQLTGAVYNVIQGAGGAMNFTGLAGCAFTVNTSGAISMATAGVFSLATAGKMFITGVGLITITATGPLTCIGAPIMLN